MTIRLDKRFSRGLSFLLAYTAGKLIDDASAEIHFLGPQGGGKLDNYNLRLERSVSAMDVAQRLVLSGVYEIPAGKGRRFLSQSGRFVEATLGGWQVNGITTIQSGLPVMVRPAFNNTNIYSGQRPNSNGKSARLNGGSGDARLAQWFDISAFSQPADYTFGNVGRVLPDVRNPGTTGLTDLSIFKNFGLMRENRLKLQYRLEAFQAFNNPQWGQPGSTVGGGGFGVITSSSGERQLQMALKLIW
jgi:hypothetical protein